jgi:hypothetical protein
MSHLAAAVVAQFWKKEVTRKATINLPSVCQKFLWCPRLQHHPRHTLKKCSNVVTAPSLPLPPLVDSSSAVFAASKVLLAALAFLPLIIFIHLV